MDADDFAFNSPVDFKHKICCLKTLCGKCGFTVNLKQRYQSLKIEVSLSTESMVEIKLL